MIANIIAKKIIEICFYALFFITPLLFTKINSELFELPKMYFVWITAIVIVGAWAIRCIASGRFIFQRTILDLPLLFFLLSQFTSFSFSSDKYLSFWGDYERLNGGILSLVSYSLLYWAFVSNMNKASSLVTCYLSLVTCFLVVLWGIPAHFGHDPTCLVFFYDYKLGLAENIKDNFNTLCWSKNFVPTERIFSTLGQPNWLASWLVAIMPLGWGFAVSVTRDTKYEMRRQFLYITYLLSLGTLFLIALFYTKSDAGFIGFIIGLIIFTSPFILNIFRQNMRRSFYVLSTLILSLIIITLNFSPIGQYLDSAHRCISILTSSPAARGPRDLIAEEITPSSDIRCIVWKGAIKIWRENPWFGTGPETFINSYYKVKPVEHNLTSEWNFAYNKAHNEYLNMAVNTGTFGLVSYLVLIGTTVWLLGHWAVRKNPIALSLLAGYVSLLITNFFGFSVVPTQLLFFLFPAIGMLLVTRNMIHKTQESDPPATSYLLRATCYSIILLASSYLLLTLFRYYLADYHFAKSQEYENIGNYQKSLSSIRYAIQLRSSVPLYHSKLSETLSSFALTTNQPDLIAAISKLIKEESDLVVNSHPTTVSFWKTRANVMLKLGTLDDKYMALAQNAYEEAAELSPTDAEITYNLAFFYWQIGEVEKSRDQAKKALSLRPGYEDAKNLVDELTKSP